MESFSFNFSRSQNVRIFVLLSMLLLTGDALTSTSNRQQMRRLKHGQCKLEILRLRGGGKSLEDLREMKYPDPNNIIKVPDDGFSIQQAVDSLDPGGCVYVGAGVQEWEYNTTITVNDNISFVGEEDSVCKGRWQICPATHGHWYGISTRMRAKVSEDMCCLVQGGSFQAPWVFDSCNIICDYGAAILCSDRACLAIYSSRIGGIRRKSNSFPPSSTGTDIIVLCEEAFCALQRCEISWTGRNDRGIALMHKSQCFLSTCRFDMVGIAIGIEDDAGAEARKSDLTRVFSSMLEVGETSKQARIDISEDCKVAGVVWNGANRVENIRFGPSLQELELDLARQNREQDRMLVVMLQDMRQVEEEEEEEERGYADVSILSKYEQELQQVANPFVEIPDVVDQTSRLLRGERSQELLKFAMEDQRYGLREIAEDIDFDETVDHNETFYSLIKHVFRDEPGYDEFMEKLHERLDYTPPHLADNLKNLTEFERDLYIELLPIAQEHRRIRLQNASLKEEIEELEEAQEKQEEMIREMRVMTSMLDDGGEEEEDVQLETFIRKLPKWKKDRIATKIGLDGCMAGFDVFKEFWMEMFETDMAKEKRKMEKRFLERLLARDDKREWKRDVQSERREEEEMWTEERSKGEQEEDVSLSSEYGRSPERVEEGEGEEGDEYRGDDDD